ncbi:MAG TPA: hypothetical protein VGN68_00810 [Sphingopyxis sp.]|jgi:hypothetical protein|nr:hypothetical protein [Sphingopyxis sp.]
MILEDTELCFGELAYETRLVAFFDILGWKSEIEAAGKPDFWDRVQSD